MIRFGIVTEIGLGENAGYARVYFDDIDIVSDWLALPSDSTKSTKQWNPVGTGSQVGCVIDDDTRQGFIAVVLWSETDMPPAWANENTLGMLFADGTEFYYDVSKHVLNVNAPQANLNITCKRLNVSGDVKITGDASVSGDFTAVGDIEGSEVKAGLIALTTHKHGGVTTGGGISGPATA